VQLRYNFRLYPTSGQQGSLARAFGCARVVFNDGLRARQEATGRGRAVRVGRRAVQACDHRGEATPERAWLGEVSAVVLQQALADLNTAYRNFFASISGKRKGRKVAPPRFRSRKDNRQAIRFTKNSRFKVLDNGRLQVAEGRRRARALVADPAVRPVQRGDHPGCGRAGTSPRSSCTTDQDETLPQVDSEVGIDLGLTHFAVMSDGTKVTAPKFLRRAARRLRRLQQGLCSQAEGLERTARRPS
jgi:putative transposase